MVLSPGESFSAGWDQTHCQQAVKEVSPRYYRSVRLHIGALPYSALDVERFAAGETARARLLLERSTFLDYGEAAGVACPRREVTWWLGERL